MIYDKQWAKDQDETCELRDYRNEFFFPYSGKQDTIYYTGNSLGLQCKGARSAVIEHLDKWQTQGVDGHFTDDNQWFKLHEKSKNGFAYLVGAKESEVSVMNGLTTNLHNLLISFYKPEGKKTKLLIEEKCFPSDAYVAETFLKSLGRDPEEDLMVLPSDENGYFDSKKSTEFLETHKDEIALFLLGGVNYYTGQRLDIKGITKKAKELNIVAGWDLAHAAGNVELELHDWGVDFAAWCTYKYLNAGPGAPSGIFVHEKHHNSNLNRLAGWWGYDAKTRFMMEPGFKPMEGADGWQQSNGPALAMCTISKTLDLFLEARKEKIFAKRDKLTSYLEFVLNSINDKYGEDYFELITPNKSSERGSQLSLYCKKDGKAIFDYIYSKGVIGDWREPNVIRLAPVPLYNSFLDIYTTGKFIEEYIEQNKK